MISDNLRNAIITNSVDLFEEESRGYSERYQDEIIRLAIVHNSVDIIENLIVNCVTISDDMLFLAAEHDRSEILAAISLYGSTDFNCKNQEELSLLEFSIINNKLNAADILLYCDLNVKSFDILIAIVKPTTDCEKRIKFVNICVNQHPDIFTKDNLGKLDIWLKLNDHNANVAEYIEKILITMGDYLFVNDDNCVIIPIIKDNNHVLGRRIIDEFPSLVTNLSKRNLEYISMLVSTRHEFNFLHKFLSLTSIATRTPLSVLEATFNEMIDSSNIDNFIVNFACVNNISEARSYALFLSKAITLKNISIAQKILCVDHGNVFGVPDEFGYSAITKVLLSGNNDILRLASTYIKKYLKHKENLKIPLSTNDESFIKLMMKHPTFKKLNSTRAYMKILDPIFCDISPLLELLATFDGY